MRKHLTRVRSSKQYYPPGALSLNRHTKGLKMSCIPMCKLLSRAVCTSLTLRMYELYG